MKKDDGLIFSSGVQSYFELVSSGLTDVTGFSPVALPFLRVSARLSCPWVLRTETNIGDHHLALQRTRQQSQAVASGDFSAVNPSHSIVSRSASYLSDSHVGIHLERYFSDGSTKYFQNLVSSQAFAVSRGAYPTMKVVVTLCSSESL